MEWSDEGYVVDESNDSEYWVSCNGKIKISGMTDSHLLNAFRKFKDGRLRDEIIIRLFSRMLDGKQ